MFQQGIIFLKKGVGLATFFFEGKGRKNLLEGKIFFPSGRSVNLCFYQRTYSIKVHLPSRLVLLLPKIFIIHSTESVNTKEFRQQTNSDNRTGGTTTYDLVRRRKNSKNGVPTILNIST